MASSRHAQARQAQGKRQETGRHGEEVRARKDLGAPVDGFFAKQPPQLAAILAELRAMIAQAAPGRDGAIKWGMPFYSVGGEHDVCAGGVQGARQPDPPRTARDLRRSERPSRGRREDGQAPQAPPARPAPRAAVRGWLRTAAARANPQVSGSSAETKTLTNPDDEERRSDHQDRSRNVSRSMCRLNGSPATARSSSARS